MCLHGEMCCSETIMVHLKLKYYLSCFVNCNVQIFHFILYQQYFDNQSDWMKAISIIVQDVYYSLTKC